MTSRQRVLLIVAIILLGVGEWGWIVWKSVSQAMETERAVLARASAQRHVPSYFQGKKGHLFSPDEVHAFLAAAKQAETITDPLQRCLAYPDPPGSHWSHDAVAAYCHYRFQPVITFAEAQALIQSGHASELDRRLSDALQAQLSQPDAHGMLDRIYYADFDKGSFDIRPTLDAWKRDSPKSAFAYAASGVAYVAMAQRARGTGYISDTPDSNVESMDRLLVQANADLKQAIALDPRVTPAYSAMIYATALDGSKSDGLDIAKRGLAADPGNYSIYSRLMWMLEPKWHGSLQEMTDLATKAQAHASQNPMLVLLLSEVPVYEANLDNCNCHDAAALALYPVALDQAASTDRLVNAGYAAASSHHPDVSAIYLSEALRFDPALMEARLHRSYDLTELNDPQWALTEAQTLVDTAPHAVGSFKARGYAYEYLEDYPHAEQDLRQATALDSNDTWALIELGHIYVHKTHEWDKGWDIANQLIQTHPDNANGWILRASIQKDQPREGLHDTVVYFLAHFANDPNQAVPVAQMRQTLAAEFKQSAGAAKPAKNP